MFRAIVSLVGQAVVCVAVGFALGQMIPWSEMALAQQGGEPRCDGNAVCDADCTASAGGCRGGCKDEDRCRDCDCYDIDESDAVECGCELPGGASGAHS